MLYLKNKIKANLYKITSTYSEEVQQILNEFDNIMSKGVHNIGNCLTIKYIIRLIINILVIGKIEYHILKEHK